MGVGCGLQLHKHNSDLECHNRPHQYPGRGRSQQYGKRAGITCYPIPKASLSTTVRYVGISWMSTGSLPVPAKEVCWFKGQLSVNARSHSLCFSSKFV